MTFLLNLIPIKYRIAAALIVAVVAMSVAFGTGWEANGWRLGAQIEQLRSEHSQEVARAAVQALMDADVQRDREKALQRKVNDAETKLQKDARIIASLRVDHGRMRQSIADYAKGTEATGDSAAACINRAEKLGLLLGEALQADRQSSLDAESESANVRTLLDSWPR